MIKAILFDLDGTLLPADQDAFTKMYFEVLARHHARYGYDPKRIVDSVWKGTAAMLKNSGQDLNANVFWREFEASFGLPESQVKPAFDKFYATDFDRTKELCAFSPKAAQAVAAAKAHSVPLVLATNPIFPIEAQVKRLVWAGANPDDFALITSYENSRYCKPNTGYYSDIAFHLGVTHNECLMIGNDTADDLAAAKIGMHVFLITDCLINKAKVDFSAVPHGGADELINYITELNS